MFQPMQFDDGRGLFPDRLTASVPRGFKSYVRRAAEVVNQPLADFVRRAVEERAHEVLRSATQARS